MPEIRSGRELEPVGKTTMEYRAEPGADQDPASFSDWEKASTIVASSCSRSEA